MNHNSSSPFQIRRLASGGVITNYHCVSRCGHCLYHCGPHREKDYLTADRAEAIFRRIGSLGCRSVHIGGGEPLLSPEKLSAVADAARRVGMGIDYVETNSAWFKSPDQAGGVLRDLRAAGIGTLLVSISPFHNAFIPFSRVRGVIEACRDAGMNVFPWVNAFVRDLDRLGDARPHEMHEFETAFGPDYLRRIPERCWIHLGGRALETFRSVLPVRPVARVLAESPGRCDSALADTSHFHIDLYGRYIPGLCAGLALDMKDLGGPLPEGTYPLLDRLVTGGIRGLYRWAADEFEFTPQRSAYLNHCDLCTEIRGHLFRRHADRFPELSPAGFYGNRERR